MVVDTKGKNIIRKPSPDTGKVAAIAVRRGKREQIRKNSFLQNGSKYLPVIFERRGKVVGNTIIKKYEEE